MNQPNNKPYKMSWFFKWILNNKASMILCIVFICFANIFIFSKIAHLFAPVVTFLYVIMLPIIISALLYYLLNPFVQILEKKAKCNRTVAISIVFIIVIGLLLWGVAVLVPYLEKQLAVFIENLPRYVEDIEVKTTNILKTHQLDSFNIELQSLVNNLSDNIIKYAQTISKSAFNWAGGFASTIARVAVALMISPFILFYLLRDGDRLKYYVSQFLPPKFRVPVQQMMSTVNSQLASYVQGQVMVAIAVAIMFSIMFSFVGLKYGIILSILAGFLNLIPYLGSFLAMVPVFILAFVTGPSMVLKCIIIFIIEQTIEGRFVTPLVLGSKLNIHPITILFVLLTAGSLWGVWGVFLAIPIYASIKVIVSEIFEWYKTASGLYIDDFKKETKNDSE